MIQQWIDENGNHDIPAHLVDLASSRAQVEMSTGPVKEADNALLWARRGSSSALRSSAALSVVNLGPH